MKTFIKTDYNICMEEFLSYSKYIHNKCFTLMKKLKDKRGIPAQYKFSLIFLVNYNYSFG